MTASTALPRPPLRAVYSLVSLLLCSFFWTWARKLVQIFSCFPGGRFGALCQFFCVDKACFGNGASPTIWTVHTVSMASEAQCTDSLQLYVNPPLDESKRRFFASIFG